MISTAGTAGGSPPVLARIVVMSAVVGVLALAAAAPAAAQAPGGTVDTPSTFTSTYSVRAQSGQVSGGGEPGAAGRFDLQLNSDLEIVCFDIRLFSVTPPLTSPAATATHIHQGAAGVAGPPVVILPDPQDIGGGVLRSRGCLERPFVEEGFSLRQIEANPAGFYADTHTSAFSEGAVRGQLTGTAQAAPPAQPRADLPVGGVAAGAGGTAGVSPYLTAAVLALAALGLLVTRLRAT
jgi:hypothetical protein